MKMTRSEAEKVRSKFGPALVDALYGNTAGERYIIGRAKADSRVGHLLAEARTLVLGHSRMVDGTCVYT